jgi:putative DNA primase/helicase
MTRRPPFEPMNYAVELASTGNYAYANDHLIHWTGTHWAQMSQEDAQRDALRWVVDNSAAIVSDASAATAVRTAMLWLPRLPVPISTDLLIPLRNGYLRHCAGSYA